MCQQLGASEESDEEGIWMVNRLIAANHEQGSQSNLPEPNLCFHSMPEFAASEQPPPVAKIIKTTVTN